MIVAILGSGGREHTLAWKIGQSPLCQSLFVLPGNPGTASIAKNVNISPDNFSGIKEFIIEEKIDMIIVGPEVPLVNGIADFLGEDENTKQVKVVGPSKTAAMLEGSKSFAKVFMQKNNIPTALYQSFDISTLKDAKQYLETLQSPYVIKADGLAAGKGVVICTTIEEAKKALDEMLLNKQFGNASEEIVIEEYLHGVEMSCFVLTDGEDYLLLPEAKDYKRAYNNDQGPNTGGMGAVSPVPFFDEKLKEKVKNRVIEPTISGLKKENIPYIGFIFIGLMIVNSEPYVIEYNIRMGDPETQAVIPRIKNDLLKILKDTTEGRLKHSAIDIDNQIAVTVVMASGGYPSSFVKGYPIAGQLENEKTQNTHGSLVFQAGTKNVGDAVVNNGGRVLSVTALGDDYNKTIEKAYHHTQKISWQDVHYRTDIGEDILKFLI